MDVHIKNLRRARRAGPAALIATVRGRGFCLALPEHDGA
jgi:DNA-binding response OmpR family regulator